MDRESSEKTVGPWESQRNYERERGERESVYPFPAKLYHYYTREKLRVCPFLFPFYHGLYHLEFIENFQGEK